MNETELKDVVETKRFKMSLERMTWGEKDQDVLILEATKASITKDDIRLLEGAFHPTDYEIMIEDGTLQIMAIKEP